MSTVEHSVVGMRGYGHGCAMAGGEKLSAATGIGVRGRKRAREEGETAQELTAGAAVASASSGRHRSERSIEGDLRRPRSETAALARLQGVRRCVAQRGSRGRRGGAYGLTGRARGGRWP